MSQLTLSLVIQLPIEGEAHVVVKLALELLLVLGLLDHEVYYEQLGQLSVELLNLALKLGALIFVSY